MSGKTESPTEPFKRALAHAARSLAEMPDLEVVFSGDGPQLSGNRAVLPHPPRDLTMAEASRIREICDVSGVRENQLIGYGLVVGLANTGDTAAARFTLQAVAAMLRRLGATIDPALVQTRNAAARSIAPS